MPQPLEPDAENGYGIEGFIKDVKGGLEIGMIRVFWKRDSHQSVAKKKNGVDEIAVATVQTIMREKGLPKNEAIAKQKTAIIEELCHLKLSKDHSPEIFVCVRREVDKHLNPEEKQMIDGKLQRLKQACMEERPSKVLQPNIQP